MNGWVGKFLGRYQVVELLGEGGMATVYKAVDTRLDREVAIKAIRSEDFPPSQAERLRKRFDREARVLAQLTHTNIVPIIDYGEHEGAPYLVMPYLPGGALKRREKGMPWREALRLVLPIADALAYAHAHGILHRDVKPSNILMTETGLPMLSDFGIARLLEDESGHTLTGTGGIGTPGYMAPEQVVGSKGLDVRADVYSLGVVLYELVAGRMPFEAERPSGILLKQMTEAPPPLGQVVKDIPPELERVLMKALARNREERYAGMVAFAKALQRVLEADERRQLAETITRLPSSQVKTVRSVELPEVAKHPQPVQQTNGTITSGKRSPAGMILTLTGIVSFLLVALGLMTLQVWKGGSGQQLVITQVTLPQITIDHPTLTPLPVEESQVQTQTSTSNVPTVTQTVTQMSTTETLPTETTAPTETQSPQPIIIQPSSLINATLPSVLIRIREQDWMETVLVPAGEFPMGSLEKEVDDVTERCKLAEPNCSRNWFTDETPQHKVYLDEFWIDRTEVTNEMYARCVRMGKCTPPVSYASYTRSNYYDDPQYANYPVIYVNWEQAQAYCKWAGAELPTEAQWEKAARGTDGRWYPWGNEFKCGLGNFDDDATDGDQYVVMGGPNCDGYSDTSPVGSFPAGASPYGALDMAGNVWEWVQDWYDAGYYSGPQSVNPSGPSSGEERVMRGGSWTSPDIDNRTTFRYKQTLDFTSYRLGFRCAFSP